LTSTLGGKLHVLSDISDLAADLGSILHLRRCAWDEILRRLDRASWNPQSRVEVRQTTQASSEMTFRERLDADLVHQGIRCARVSPEGAIVPID